MFQITFCSNLHATREKRPPVMRLARGVNGFVRVKLGWQHYSIAQQLARRGEGRRVEERRGTLNWLEMSSYRSTHCSFTDIQIQVRPVKSIEIMAWHGMAWHALLYSTLLPPSFQS
mmetsp:Transcript_12571/g.21209  ORF Transcript_12571/g.21209 Transcript_12571/m.21209 type:complete len:116 (+) Transcript_12571:665-1012(+)